MWPEYLRALSILAERVAFQFQHELAGRVVSFAEIYAQRAHPSLGAYPRFELGGSPPMNRVSFLR